MLRLALLLSSVCLIGACVSTSQAGAASRDDNHLSCTGFLQKGSGVTHIVVKAEKKRDEDTWSNRPTWLSAETKPGWVGAPGFLWSTQAELFRGCSNAVTFAVVDARHDQALIGISVAQSFGAGAAGRTAECHVLAVSHPNAHFTCHRYHEEHLNGKFRVSFRVTSP